MPASKRDQSIIGAPAIVKAAARTAPKRTHNTTSDVSSTQKKQPKKYTTFVPLVLIGANVDNN